jgi:hypothetical protein
MTAAKNPVHMEAVAARAPCRDEKKVPTRAGSAEPVKIPVIFYHGRTVSLIEHSWYECVLELNTYIYETQINVNAMKHGSKGSHENGKAGNTPMPCTKNLCICGFRVDVCNQ